MEICQKISDCTLDYPLFAGNQKEYISLKLMELWCLHALHGAFTALIKYFG